MRGFLRACMLVLLMMTAAPSGAEEMAFGGRGEDVLYEAVTLEDGWFAVGKTASTDGDLASRKRSGETGWAIRIGGDGRRMWDFCSAKSGMYEMIAPHAYEDGRFACVLTDETRQRGEWIVLDARGRQESRVPFDAETPLCPHDGRTRIVQMIPAKGNTGPYLALLLAHEGSGEMCASALFPDGGVRSCGAFFGDLQGTAVAARKDGVLFAGTDLGALSVTRLRPGAQPQTQTIPLAVENAGLAHVDAALLGGDDSLLVGGRITTADQKSKAALLRVNAEGELLFLRQLGEAETVLMLCETDMGYAALLGSSVLFMDEDGALQGQAQAAQPVMDMLMAEGGVLTLTQDPERGRRQAVFAHLVPEALTTPIVPEQITAPIRTPVPAPVAAVQGELPLDEGYLRCTDGGYSGVTVERVDANALADAHAHSYRGGSPGMGKRGLYAGWGYRARWLLRDEYAGRRHAPGRKRAPRRGRRAAGDRADGIMKRDAKRRRSASLLMR